MTETEVGADQGRMSSAEAMSRIDGILGVAGVREGEAHFASVDLQGGVTSEVTLARHAGRGGDTYSITLRRPKVNDDGIVEEIVTEHTYRRNDRNQPGEGSDTEVERVLKALTVGEINEQLSLRGEMGELMDLATTMGEGHNRVFHTRDGRRVQVVRSTILGGDFVLSIYNNEDPGRLDEMVRLRPGRPLERAYTGSDNKVLPVALNSKFFPVSDMEVRRYISTIREAFGPSRRSFSS